MRHAHALTGLNAGHEDFLAPAFECSWRYGARESAWVNVAGELDVATTPQLERMLRERQLEARLVVLDLRGLVFMDCSGVHAIVDASIRARKVGRRLVVLRGRAHVDRMFTLTESVEYVEIRDADALLRLAEVQPR